MWLAVVNILKREGLLEEVHVGEMPNDSLIARCLCFASTYVYAQDTLFQPERLRFFLVQ